jgi:hypothetical protein
MINSIQLKLRKEDCICNINCNRVYCEENNQNILNNLQHVQEHSNTNNGTLYYTGELSNLRIYVNDNNVRVNGNLAKYYYSNNLATLNIDDTKRAIEKLSDELHIPMGKATITRIDFGTNFILENRPYVYYNHLGDLDGFIRSNIQENTLYYKQNNKCLCFCDNGIGARLEDIPSEYRNKNILRYELRFTGRLEPTFNKEKITASLLYNVDFYNKLLMQYKSYYNNINKLNDNIFEVNNIRTKSDFYNFSSQYVINCLGVDNLMNGIKRQQRRHILTNKQTFDLINLIKHTKTNNLPNATSTIDELTEKINSI